MPIQQEITFKCEPSKVYEALTNADTFSRFTGGPATIEEKDGGAFSCFGGQITGRQIELKKDEMIVQAWRAGPWPVGVYSIVQFTLVSVDDGTKLTLIQSGIPEGTSDHLEEGWRKMYWQPLKDYCG